MFRPAHLVAVVVAALAVFLAGAPAVSAATPDAACKNGGYARYIDPSTGAPFKKQGQCVAFIARGGTLVPIAPSSVNLTFQATGDPDYCTIVVNITGTPNTTYSGQVFDSGEPIGGPLQVTTNSAGTASQPIFSYFRGNLLSAVFNGVSSPETFGNC